MKKILYSMMAMAIAAFTFTACEDVPEPYNNPYANAKGEEVVEVDPVGSGTKDDPWNVTALANACEGLAEGAFLKDGAEVYVKGFVVETTEVSAQYGNATYYISDVAKNGKVRFYVFRGKLLDGASVTDANDLKVGDEVIVCGKVKNYKPTSGDAVLEFDQGNYLVYLNGKTSGGDKPDVKTVGSKDAPKSVSEALAAINAMEDNAVSQEFWFVKGKVVKVTTTQTNFETYKNLNYLISEDGTETNTITVYSGDGLNGDKFTGIDALGAGDEVIVYGQIQKYVKNGNMTPEIAKGNYLVALNKGGNEPTNTVGSKDAPKTVAEALAAIDAMEGGATTAEFWYIKGKVKTIKTTAANIAQYKNIDYIITDDGNNELTVFRGKNLDNTDFTSADDLKVGEEVVVYGQLQKYVKNDVVTPEVAQGNYLVKKENGSDTPTTNEFGTKDNPKTVAEALTAINGMEAGVNSTEFWYIKGKVKTIKTSAENIEKYKNIDYIITDDGNNELTVFRGKNLDNTDFTSADDLTVGEEVVVYGQLLKYVKNDVTTPEVAQGNYLVKKENTGGSGQGGDQGGGSGSGASASINFSAQGYSNAQAVTSATIADGTTITFDAGENNNAPKYYDSGSAIRMYPKNFFTIDANKTISSVTITCSANNAEGNVTTSAGTLATDNMTITISSINATSVKVTNAHTGTGAASQLRIASLTVNYAQ